MSNLFGTDGIRGVAGDYPLDVSTLRTIGAAFTRCMKQRLGRDPRYVSGRDTRESGPSIESAFYEGAASQGATCESAGVITTPGVAFLARKFEFDAGVVISASHNPFQDNGIKIFLPTGIKLDDNTEKEIELAVSNGIELRSETFDVQFKDRSSAFRNGYLEHIHSCFTELDLKGSKVIADCANGAASGLAADIFGHFGADVETIFAAPNGRNINMDCGSLHLEGLQKKVLGSGADFGVAFDGDADRALFVDEKGNVVDGDATMFILAKDLKKNGLLGTGKVVNTVMSNVGLEIALRSEGIAMIRTPVGDKFVLEKLLETGSELGGEQSGHIILPQISLVGDGMITALLVLKAMKRSGRSLSELQNGFVKYPQILINVPVRSKVPFDEIEEINEKAKEIESRLAPDGRLLLRYSGTENLARVMIEGKDQGEIEELANSLAEVIKRSLG